MTHGWQSESTDGRKGGWSYAFWSGCALCFLEWLQWLVVPVAKGAICTALQPSSCASHGTYAVLT